MNRARWTQHIATAIAAFALSTNAMAGEVYTSLMAEFSKHVNRLPASEGFESSLEALKKTFSNAGLEPHVMTFETLVPDTKECYLTVDGQEIKPVYALGPDGIANNTTGGDELSGPLVWLGNGSLEDMKGKEIDGSIAVLWFDSPNMKLVFSQGALGVVFVGRGDETQWKARNQFLDLGAVVPRLYVSEATAREHGLMDAASNRKAALKVTTVWKDAVGENLWVEIPGEEGAVFGVDSKPEAIVLLANLDTFGTIPQLSPALRKAANCALTAEVMVDLAKTKPKRSIFAAFLGSHYSVEEASRYFFRAVRKAQDPGADSFKHREEGHKRALATAQDKVKLLRSEDLFESKDENLPEITKLIEQRLAAQVSAINTELREQSLEESQKKRAGKLTEEEAEAYEQRRLNLREQRKARNLLRAQVNDREITDKETFAAMAAELTQELVRQQEQLKRALAHNKTFQELEQRIANRRIVGCYGFDFADANEPWLINMSGSASQIFYHAPHHNYSILFIGRFLRNMQTLVDSYETIRGKYAGGELFTDYIDGLSNPDVFCYPTERSTPTRIPHAIKIFGYQFVTLADRLDADEMPYPAPVDLSALTPQMTAYMHSVADMAEMSQTCPLRMMRFSEKNLFQYRGTGTAGYKYQTLARGSTDIEGPPKDGIYAASQNGQEKIPYTAGNTRYAMGRIQASAHVHVPMLYNHLRGDPRAYNKYGDFTQFKAGGRWIDERMCYGYGGIFFLPFPAMKPGRRSAFDGQILMGSSDSTPKYKGGWNGLETVSVYIDEPRSVKLIEPEGLLVLGATEEHPTGVGVDLFERPLYSRNIIRQSALDYTILNESRLKVLRTKGIINDSLETLHADAKLHVEQANNARERNDIPEAFGHEISAMMIGARVAKPLRDVANDLVQAVVILLLLAIPFAFAMERLVFHSTDIYRQVVGFAGMFLGTFALLYVTHPAFSLASAPIIIFLAFVIILLGATVTYIIMSKFKRELRSVQGLSTTAHGAASDSSTAMAAVLIGISGMRNRPLKTGLTAVTVILLTFTIVVFASFTSRVGVNQSYLGKGEGTDRVELRRFSSREMPRPLLSAMRALYGDNWHVIPREAWFAMPGRSPIRNVKVAFNPKNSKHAELTAMMAFDPAEPGLNPQMAAILPGLAEYKGDNPPIFLSKAVAESMELVKGDEVSIAGTKFTYAGEFDAAGMAEQSYLDGAKITPPDFIASAEEMSPTGQNAGLNEAEIEKDTFDPTRFVYSSSRRIGVTTVGALDDFGGLAQVTGINQITLYPKGDADAEVTARSIAKMFMGPVLTKDEEGVNQYFFKESVKASGFSEVIIPLLLGGLIIFSSLLGSIVEREKEIFTYSALGLSPPDVGSLFFAESCVYAILGGMGGYLLSQVVAKLFSIAGKYGLFQPPEMNFSSLSSIATILLVMATVILSTIYPAMKAGKSANPGVARKWRMPKPEGDDIQFVFPFTVSAADMGGILCFVKEHFANHGDSSLGNFAAKNVELFRTGRDEDAKDSLGIKASVSLAPFDLGVMQQFALTARESEIEGIDEAVVTMKRISGTHGAWLRGNRQFVDELREQFLLWRSLPVETVAHYKAESKKILEAMG